MHASLHSHGNTIHTRGEEFFFFFLGVYFIIHKKHTKKEGQLNCSACWVWSLSQVSCLVVGSHVICVERSVDTQKHVRDYHCVDLTSAEFYGVLQELLLL